MSRWTRSRVVALNFSNEQKLSVVGTGRVAIGKEREKRRSNDKVKGDPDQNKEEEEPTGDFRGANGDKTRTFGARRGVNDRKGQRERNRQPNLREV